MKLYVRLLCFSFLTPMSYFAAAQTSDTMTSRERAIAELKDQRVYEQAKRCYATIAVPGDVTLNDDEIDQLGLELEAENIELPNENTIELSGNAYAQQGPKKITADKLRYSKGEGLVNADGQVEIFSQNGDRLKTQSLELELETFTGTGTDIQYYIAKRDLLPKEEGFVFVSARGKAEHAKFLGHDLLELDNVTYTTCKEGNNDVVIKADRITLDHADGTGVARNATLKFLGAPIFYLPYVSFPINDERKTGILTATFGSDSESGFFFGVPYYWNISPGMDATITPRYFSDRGYQIAGEFRYLTKNMEGVFSADYLPSDDLRPNDDDDRSAVTFYHEQDITEDLSADIDFQWASDDDYYDDFPNNIYLSSATHLIRRARLNYYGDIFRFESGVLDYLTVDNSIADSSKPYAKLPYLTFNADEKGPLGLKYELDGSATQFDRDETVEGWRYALNPAISLPLKKTYGYIKPKFGLDYVAYSLDNVDSGEEDSPYRLVSTTSIDSGLFFERELLFNNQTHIQTLEPRIFYVYIPEEDQAAMPNFDTSELNLNNFSNIFRENRFVGSDRIGDTNQVTFGLTSNFINDETQDKVASFSIGQIYYLSDREISLSSDESNIDQSTSDFLAQGEVELFPDWRVSAYTSWDTDESETRVRQFSVAYDDPVNGENYMSFGYYYNRDANDDEQINFSTGWRINPTWSIEAKDVYSIRDSENRYLSAAIKYDSCCWNVSLGAERRFDRDQDDRDTIFLTLEFTGLTKLGINRGVK